MAHPEMPPTTRPIILHAGFHKTGTSSVQHTLRANRGLLKAHCKVVLKWRAKQLLHATRGYSTYPDPVSLAKVSLRADAFWGEQPDYDQRGLILSAEELVGHMPGRGDITTYSAAIALLTEIIQAAQRRYGAPDLRVVISTRAPDSWLTSAYWEHVKSSSMTMDLQAFRALYAPAAQTADLLDELAAAIAPVPLIRLALEHWTSHPLGLAAPILQMAEVPTETLNALETVPPANTRLPDAMLQQLLDLNRNISDRETRRAAKQALVATFQPQRDDTSDG